MEDLESRVAALERSLQSLDTQVDATEQALAAMQVTQQNKAKIRELDERLEVAIRSLNAIACVMCGAVLIWFANPLISDAMEANDRIGEWLFMGGGGCIAYGLLVLTQNEGRVMGWIETINPWRRS